MNGANPHTDKKRLLDRRLRCRKCKKRAISLYEAVSAGITYPLESDGTISGRIVEDTTHGYITEVGAECSCGYRWVLRKVYSVRRLVDDSDDILRYADGNTGFRL